MGCEGIMDIDLPAEVGPTEETVEALLEYLVCPLLPLKHSDVLKDTPSESQLKSVAKQVHAAAVLYNYYHLSHHKEKDFLKFHQFCNLAIMFKPSILHHMKYMSQSDHGIMHDPEEQLSLTEKAIMDACTISETLLDASENVSTMIKEWPITKVAVLLIDSNNENCFLQFNNGVWSPIEKDLYFEDSGVSSESKRGRKRKLSLMSEDGVEGEDEFQQLAFSAVKEVAGIMNSKLKILEGHVVYSLSRAKTATRFYIVQSTQAISEDKLVPIQDVFSSLQGPVVKKSSDSWVITAVVEYYYLLPYADIISQWFSRISNSIPHQAHKGNTGNIVLGSQKSHEDEIGESKVSSDNLQMKLKLELEGDMSNLSNEEPHKSKVIETANSVDNRVTCSNGDGMKDKNVNGSCTNESNNLSCEVNNNKGIDKPLVCLQKENLNTKMCAPLTVYSYERKTVPRNSISIKENPEDLKSMSTISEWKDVKFDGEKKFRVVSSHEDRKLTSVHNPASFNQNESIEDFQVTMDAKTSELSKAALRVLLKRRQKLCDQQQNIANELISCDKKIHAITHGGIGDCLDLKLEAIIDYCNETCQQDDMQTEEHTNLHVSRSFPLSSKSLSKAQLMLQKACQELDDICLSNGWMLPTYHTSPSDSGFVVSVAVKGSDFECSGVSGMQPTIHEARNLAATHLIIKLQQMAMDRPTDLL